MVDTPTRVGLIVPSTNTTNETEFTESLPPNVTLHTSRVPGGKCTADVLEQMAEDIEQRAKLLADARVDVIGFGCTTGSLIKGPGYAEEIRSRIENATDTPAVVTAGAVSEALSVIEASSVSVTTPYPDEMNIRVRGFLESNGFEVDTIRGLGLLTPAEVSSQPVEAVYSEAVSVIDDRSDCLFISCTDYPTFDVLNSVESEIGCPVVTSNQATLWQSCRRAGIDYSDISLGTLFEY